jgi:acetyltransferase-like isoleucine patch superfamily enzyme
MRAGLASGETSRAAFYRGVLQHRVLSRRDIWIGSRAVIDGADRIRITPGGALRVGIGPFGLTCADDPTVVRVREGAEFVADGTVSLQRGTRVVVDGGQLRIGHATNVNGFTKILCADGITIGAYCTISWDVQILDNDFHTITVDGAERPSRAPVVIGDRVWVGTRAVVLKGVTIGDGAVIGAGAIVTRDVPPGVIATGAPATAVANVDGWQ